MKNIFFCLFLIFFYCFNSIAQNQDLTSAIIALDNKRDVESAKYAIDNATQKIESGSLLKAKKMSKYYHYKGKIYLTLFEKAWFDTEILPDFSLLSIASDAFLSDSELSGSHSKKSITQLNRCARLYQDAAYKDYENKDYTASENKFSRSISINSSKAISKVDTLNMFNACLTSFLDEKYDKSISWALKLINLNPLDVRYHIKLIESYSEIGDLENQLNSIKNARINVPQSKEIIFKEVNYYISSGENELLLESLDNAVASDPDNAVLHFVLGSTYSSLNNLEKAKLSYENTISIDPNYVDAYNNLAAMYLDEANIFIDKKNNLPINASQKKYNDLSNKIQGFRLKALPYLEKVLMLQPTDNIIIETLKQIYYQLEMDQKSLQMRNLMDLNDQEKKTFVNDYFSD